MAEQQRSDLFHDLLGMFELGAADKRSVAADVSDDEETVADLGRAWHRVVKYKSELIVVLGVKSGLIRDKASIATAFKPWERLKSFADFSHEKNQKNLSTTGNILTSQDTYL